VMERVFQRIMGGGDLIQQLRDSLAAGWGPAPPARQPPDLVNMQREQEQLLDEDDMPDWS